MSDKHTLTPQLKANPNQQARKFKMNEPALEVRDGDTVTWKAENYDILVVFVDTANMGGIKYAPFGMQFIKVAAGGNKTFVIKHWDKDEINPEYEYIVYLKDKDELIDGNSRPKIIIKSDTISSFFSICNKCDYREPIDTEGDPAARVALQGFGYRIEEGRRVPLEDELLVWELMIYEENDWQEVNLDDSRVGPEPDPVELKPGLYRIILRHRDQPESMDSVEIEVVQQDVAPSLEG